MKGRRGKGDSEGTIISFNYMLLYLHFLYLSLSLSFLRVLGDPEKERERERKRNGAWKGIPLYRWSLKDKKERGSSGYKRAPVLFPRPFNEEKGNTRPWEGQDHSLPLHLPTQPLGPGNGEANMKEREV
jgi:hypothetical protein